VSDQVIWDDEDERFVAALTEPDIERRLLWEAMEYAQHDSWRCEHPDRYPPDPDCPCGLLSLQARVLAAIGSPPDDWQPLPIDIWPPRSAAGQNKGEA